MDYANLWIATFCDGEYTFNPQVKYLFLPLHRVISVRHDNNTYYYKAPPTGDLHGFKGWLSSVFAHGITRRITGRYPNYMIEEA